MKRITDSIFNRIVKVRRDLHQHPELSWEEHRTTERICAELDKLDISYFRPLKTGVIADLPGPKGVPKVALRADIDALPIFEETGLPFTSTNEGIMHACGHDGHTAMLIGAAEILSKKKNLPAPVRLIFQPAEEKGNGANKMLKAGALDDVGMIFGGHLDRHFPTGSLVVTEGPVNAAADAFRIEISGQGAHAARPHESVDAVVVGSLMVMAIQTIVSREVNPAHPAVISVGRFEAGTVANAIAAQAVLEGTIRTQEDVVRDHFSEAIRRIAESVGRLHGASIKVDIFRGNPVLSNPPEMTEIARKAAINVVEKSQVKKLILANMGGEDFGNFMEKVPGCYIRFGAMLDGHENFPAHSSKFYFDEKALAYGTAWFCEVAEIAGRILAKNTDDI
ncbi:MAG: amidohydrolase [Bacteroidetes bacterium]|nr:amidohydrolase [Bacteroidota bacterium]